MAGKIIADTLEHSTAGSIATNYVVEGSAKSWVNFDGSGTIATRESLNVSSLIDAGVGNYRVVFSSSMNTATYSFSIGSSSSISNDAYNRSSLALNTTSQAALLHYESGGSQTDTDLLTFNIHGDLA